MGTRAEKVLKKRKGKDKQGKPIIRSDSRPQGSTTGFTMRGDTLTNIGDGPLMQWDFSNADNEVTDSITTAIPANHKRKRLEIGFSDDVWIKEGTLYWKNAPVGCYIDFWVICKNGGYYADLNGTISGSSLGLDEDLMYTQATADTPTVHYVNNHFLFDTCVYGDELNTEGAMEDALPSQQNNYVLWLEITTPDTDVVGYGHAALELYRNRTLLLPGENV